MNFKQRLSRFLIGVLIGVVLSGFFFKDKLGLLTSWLPGNRVIDRIQMSYWMMSDHEACLLDCHELDVETLKIALEDAKVDFGSSQTKPPVKEYAVSLFQDPDVLNMRFSLNDSTATLVQFHSPKLCDCP
jgi:hypothetical protein